MISIKNQEIRSAVKEAGIKMWQLADEVGIADTTLCRRLRHELSEDEKALMDVSLNGGGIKG